MVHLTRWTTHHFPVTEELISPKVWLQIMTILVPYSTLTSSGYTTGSYVQVKEFYLHGLIRSLLPAIKFDEIWYLKRYRDIADALESGELASARDHYMTVGYFENRFPREITVQERWYLNAYDDVAEALQRGKFENAQQHFEKDGFTEGRLPFSGWQL